MQIKGEDIIHYCDRPIEPGSAVTGRIDWAHRFDNMQQHTGEHIVSGLVKKYFGYNNVGFHLSDETVTMDYDRELTDEQIRKLESLANQAIWEDRPVTAWYPPAGELAALDYRSKIDLTEGVRLVKIEGVDLCACCAPHVARTGEIGVFRILSVQSHRGGVRIHMLAGERAFRYLAQEDDILTGAARSLSAPPELVPERIEKLRLDLCDTKHLLSGARLDLLMKEAGEIPASQKNVCLFTEEMEEPTLREVINRLMAVHEGVCGIFNGNDTDGYRYVIGSTTDVLSMQKRLKETLQARGGGKPPMIQGQIHAGRAAIEALFQ